jgi:subtilisin family serine protease
MVVIINNECLKKKGPQSIITTAIDVNHRDDRIVEQAYPFTLNSAFAGTELNRIAANDTCIVRLGENSVLSILSLPNDPKLAEAAHLDTIKFANSFDGYFNPTNGIKEEIRIAVIDTGIDPSHPDLMANILLDANQKVFGLNSMVGSDPNDIVDSNFHGTHVAGLAAAVNNNSFGISGVMGSNIKIMPVKVSKDGQSVDMDAVINGVRWAADNKADVINMSLGSTGNNPLFKEAIKYAIKKGVTVVVAAGNNGRLLDSNFSITPASWGSEIPGLITVGSIDAVTMNRSSFSNYSPTLVELYAPGSNGSIGILSTVPTALTASGFGRIYNGNPINGTSMASPVAAGAAALLISISRSRGYDMWSDKSGELMSFGLNGARLNLVTLLNGVNQLMNIRDTLNTPRQEARGTITITQHPQGKTVGETQAASMSVTLSSDSSFIRGYQWFKNGAPIRGANQPTYEIPKATLADGAQYFVEVAAGQNKVRSQSMKLYIQQKCP